MTKAPVGKSVLWTPDQCAEVLGVSVTTLKKWRHERSGPPFYRVGRLIRYNNREVARWLVARRRGMPQPKIVGKNIPDTEP